MYMVIVAYHKPYVDDIYHNTALRWLFSINHLFVFLARNKTHCVLMLFASPIKIGVSNWNVGSINQCCLGKKTLLKMDILGLHVKNMANWIVGSINQFIEAVSVRKLSLKKHLLGLQVQYMSQTLPSIFSFSTTLPSPQHTHACFNADPKLTTFYRFPKSN